MKKSPRVTQPSASIFSMPSLALHREAKQQKIGWDYTNNLTKQ